MCCLIFRTGLLVWTALLLSPEPLAGEDWYRYRGPRLNGISEETVAAAAWVPEGPPVAWTREVGTGFSSVSLRDGRLYTMGNSDDVDTVWCLDAGSGQTIWKHAYDSPTDPNEFEGGPTSTPTVDGDAVYTLSRQGELFCFDAAAGEVRWQINIADQTDVRIPTWGFAGSPLICGDTLIVNVGDAGAAVNKHTGESLWSSADKDAGYATPVPIDTPQGQAVIIGSGRSYVCVDVANGQLRWRQRWLTTFGCNAADAIVSGNEVLLSSAYNRGAALLQLDHSDAPSNSDAAPSSEVTVLWKHKDLQNQLGTSVLLDGYVYGIHGNLASGGQLRCIDWKTGEVQWSDDSLRYGAIAATATQLIVLSDRGELRILPASPRQQPPTHRAVVLDDKCWTTPVLSNQRLYCRGASGTLICLDLSQVQ
ncbi:PQQ-binding-like beta-propeller repeat protein [Roseimaritima ulvae]|uniref:Outer membrane biogenesis protein BamB n=1 Tax=Roseimaritima ulvae TaxID=980254 RepID=A0A5B9QHN6_9BACT|nr:PQQ-binding-like beta-propeller repeat protein [Roseimaritima ulvae]QEG38354.1 outer membrane biogenesis protein BamB [Roseimaritima ulvae]